MIILTKTNFKTQSFSSFFSSLLPILTLTTSLLDGIFSRPPIPRYYLPLQCDISTVLTSISDILNTVPTPVSELPAVKPIADFFDAGVCSVWGSFNSAGSIALKAVNICSGTVGLPHFETSSVTNNYLVVGPSLKGTFITACTTLFALYLPNILDLIHPIADGFHVLNLYYFDVLFQSVHGNFPNQTFLWNATLYWWNQFPLHIPYGYNFFDLFDGMPSGFPQYVIDLTNSPFPRYTILGQSHSDLIDSFILAENPLAFIGQFPNAPRVAEVITPMDRAEHLYDLYTSKMEFTPWKLVLGGFLSIFITPYLLNILFNLY